MIATHLNPFALAHRDPSTGLYTQGTQDIVTVFVWVLTFTLLREALMRYFWTPIGRALGAPSGAKVLRFAEQGWSFAYACVFFTMGLYIMQTSPHAYLNTYEFWNGYPHDRITYLMKFYYLAQIGFWIQQVVVLNMEKRRKDHYQMLTHHFITITLSSLSYLCNWTRIGNAIFVLMDAADIFLPAAKMTKYLGWQKTCDSLFFCFMVSWVVPRHFLYMKVLLSLVFQCPTMLELDWRPQDGFFLNHAAFRLFVGLLSFLQLILLAWLTQIFRVVYLVVTGKGADDTRSDSEDETEDVDEPAEGKKARKVVDADEKKVGGGGGGRARPAGGDEPKKDR